MMATATRIAVPTAYSANSAPCSSRRNLLNLFTCVTPTDRTEEPSANRHESETTRAVCSFLEIKTSRLVHLGRRAAVLIVNGIAQHLVNNKADSDEESDTDSVFRQFCTLLVL